MMTVTQQVLENSGAIINLKQFDLKNYVHVFFLMNTEITFNMNEKFVKKCYRAKMVEVMNRRSEPQNRLTKEEFGQ